jgi:hypothetical protein
VALWTTLDHFGPPLTTFGHFGPLWTTLDHLQSGQWGFIKYRPPKKNQIATKLFEISATQHYIRKSSLKSAYLHYLLLSPEINYAASCFQKAVTLFDLLLFVALFDWDKSK